MKYINQLEGSKKKISLKRLIEKNALSFFWSAIFGNNFFSSHFSHSKKKSYTFLETLLYNLYKDLL